MSNFSKKHLGLLLAGSALLFALVLRWAGFEFQQDMSAIFGLSFIPTIFLYFYGEALRADNYETEEQERAEQPIQFTFKKSFGLIFFNAIMFMLTGLVNIVLFIFMVLKELAVHAVSQWVK